MRRRPQRPIGIPIALPLCDAAFSRGALMAQPTNNATTLTITVPELRREITAVIEPGLEPDQQRAVDEAARRENTLSEVVRVLITHSAHLGRSVRSLAIEDARQGE